jgi:hypothetical protein
MEQEDHGSQSAIHSSIRSACCRFRLMFSGQTLTKDRLAIKVVSRIVHTFGWLSGTWPWLTR